MIVYRPGPELSASQLNDMAFDGLLIKIGSDCWISADTPLDSLTRAEVVGEPALFGTVYSHATAHWLWWGCGYAPTRLTLTTRQRRRLRRSYDDLAVYERNVCPAEEESLHSVPVTSKPRTLFDEFRDAPWLEAPQAEALAQARYLLHDVPAADVWDFAEYVHRQYRRPHLLEVRQLLAHLGVG